MTPIKQHIEQHIEQHHGGNQAAFARAIGSSPQQVTKWINKGFIITTDGWILNPKSHKRDTGHIHQNTDAP